MTSEESIGARLAQMFSLSGKTALITGAGSGLGRATAKLFAEVGAEVVIADLVLESAAAAAEEITANGGHAIAVQCDVSEEADVVRAFQATDDAFGKLDILVNNAAHRAKNEFFEMTVEQWDKMHHVCTRGTFLCSREAIKRMQAAGAGGSKHFQHECGSYESLGNNIRGPVTGPGRVPMGSTEPVNVAHAVLFLASPAANDITGQMLAVEGGFLVS